MKTLDTNSRTYKRAKIDYLNSRTKAELLDDLRRIRAYEGFYVTENTDGIVSYYQFTNCGCFQPCYFPSDYEYIGRVIEERVGERIVLIGTGDVQDALAVRFYGKEIKPASKNKKSRKGSDKNSYRR